jgi:predicted O-methyltransferase YrrM
MKMSALDKYINERGLTVSEGYSQQVPGQVENLIQLCKGAKTIMEIGFNGGHSAEIFLKHSDAIVTSFDLGSHNYVNPAKEYIDTTYPGRHSLVLGNSVVTIPKFVGGPFDVIFIDGGHDVRTAVADLANCKRLAHKDTLVLMDDTMYTEHWVMDWTRGPTYSWTEAIKKGEVIEDGKADYDIGRGMSWGKYGNFI